MLGLGLGLSRSSFVAESLLLDTYSGAAAAYSLRKLSADYTGSAIRVRRDSDNAEQDIAFSGNDLDTAALESFVKSETTTLPADFGSGATAAYSLRYVTNSYSGAVIRVRRSSDNAEQDFTPSEITDGTMAAWVNTDVVFINEDFSSSAGWSVAFGTVSITGGVLNFPSPQTSNLIFKSYALKQNQQVKVTFTISNYVSGSVRFENFNSGASGTPRSANGTYTEILTVSASGNANWGFNGSFVGDIDDLIVEQLTADGHVTTWYDQSGNSNDATQATAGNQPKVVDAGVLVTENGKAAVDFDGVDDYMTSLSFGISGNVLRSFFEVVSRGDTSGSSNAEGRIFIGDSVVNNGDIWALTNEYGVRVQGGNEIYGGGSINNQELAVNILSGTNVTQNTFYLNGSEVSAISASALTISTDSSLNYMGTNRNKTAFANYKSQEIIIYNTDQSANRTEIEYAINDYYNIYTPTANGFVTTWYDQSGNTNDATQGSAASQPQIVSSGSVLTENSKPCVDFNGSSHFLKASYSLSDYPITSYIVERNAASNTGYAWSLNNDLSATQYLSSSDNSFNNIAFYSVRNSANVVLLTAFASPIQNSIFSYSAANNDHNFALNGGSLVSSTSTTTFPAANNIALGRLRFVSTALYYDGIIQELVLWPSDQSSNRTAIEANINNYYSIYS